MNEGELSGVLGLQGWPAVAEEAIIARDVLLAAHVGSRLHVCHVSTAGSVEILRWAKSKGWNVTAEVTPHHLLLTDELATIVRPGLQGQPAAAHRRGRRRAARGARRRHHRRGRHRPRAARARGQGLRVGRGRDGDARPRDRAVGRAGGDGRDRPARLGRGRRPDVGPAGRGSAWLDGHGRPLEAGAPANLVLRRPGGAARRSTRSRWPRGRRNTPYAGRTLPGAVVATFLRGRPTVLDGKLSDRAHGRHARIRSERRYDRPHGAAGPRGRPHLPRRRPTARSARRSARRCSPPA